MTTASGTLAPGGASPGGGSPSAVRSGPRPPAVRRGVLVVAVVGALLLGFLVLTALVTHPAGRPALDLASAESDGTRALAQILRARGVVVSPPGRRARGVGRPAGHARRRPPRAAGPRCAHRPARSRLAGLRRRAGGTG
ncbi:hypothetical protein [Candidatus Frankia alpina]|uniref:hypothetical protein n=1 Tax=Candidatus Frankia alpina TaxID=2699483 RepID=UPI001F3D1B81|nr:hypothetical protein [Candidatus Frankia alpina]